MTQEEFRELVLKLRDELHFTHKRLLRDLYREKGSVLCVVPADKIVELGLQYYYGQHFHSSLVDSTHFGIGRMIRNWLGRQGVQRTVCGTYILDEIWAPITEMALGLREIDLREFDMVVPGVGWGDE